MSRSRDRMIAVAARIAELRVELARLDREFDALRGEDGPGAPACAIAPRVKNDSGEAGTAERVVGLLNSDPTAVFTVTSITERLGLGATAVASVRSTLARLTKDMRVNKVGRGRFRSVASMVEAEARDQSDNFGMNGAGRPGAGIGARRPGAGIGGDA